MAQMPSVSPTTSAAADKGRGFGPMSTSTGPHAIEPDMGAGPHTPTASPTHWQVTLEAGQPAYGACHILRKGQQPAHDQNAHAQNGQQR